MISNELKVSTRLYGADVTNEARKFLEACLKRNMACCPNCEHFNSKLETCIINNNLRPPAPVIAFGCPAFKYNDIPF